MVKGPNALAFVQYVSSNDASVLYPGKIQYDCFPNGKGGIVDDFLTYCIDGQKGALQCLRRDLPAGSPGPQGSAGHAETL